MSRKICLPAIENYEVRQPLQHGAEIMLENTSSVDIQIDNYGHGGLGGHLFEPLELLARVVSGLGSLCLGVATKKAESLLHNLLLHFGLCQFLFEFEVDLLN